MKKDGFTLLELIIVIIILGVLASLALPRMFALKDKAKAEEAITHLSAIRKYMEGCYMYQQSYTGCSTMEIIGYNSPGDGACADTQHFTICIQLNAPAEYRIQALLKAQWDPDGDTAFTPEFINMEHNIAPNLNKTVIMGAGAQLFRNLQINVN